MQLRSDSHINHVKSGVNAIFHLVLHVHNIPNTLSHTFFYMCMTLMQCRTSRSFQYGKYQNTDLFFQYADSSFPFFLTLTEHNIDVINLFEELYTAQTPWLHTGLRISVEWSLPPVITVPNRQEPTVAHVHNFPIILKT